MKKSTIILTGVVLVVIIVVAWSGKKTPVIAPDSTSTATNTQISFPKGGEQLVAGKTYTLAWTGGSDPTQIFLIDTSLLSVGASVSSVDRVYNVKNTDTYAYTIPQMIKPGTYALAIGNQTSKTFTIVPR